MSRLSLALLAVATIVIACYKDDVTTAGAPNSRKPMAKVLLTDAPFPFDSVQSVQVYIVSIALSTHPDTGTSADSMHWVTVAAPHRQIDLLTLQQGLTEDKIATLDDYQDSHAFTLQEKIALHFAEQLPPGKNRDTVLTHIVGNWANVDAPNVEAAIHMENRTQILASTTGDVAEAAAAFMERRPPVWGRNG